MYIKYAGECVNSTACVLLLLHTHASSINQVLAAMFHKFKVLWATSYLQKQLNYDPLPTSSTIALTVNPKSWTFFRFSSSV